MSKSSVKIAPSILAADYSRLGQEVADVAAAGADWIHLDVMDGHFVPNISFGPDVIAALRPKTDLLFDCHLMISPTDPYLEAFAKAGCDLITIHVEAGPHLHRSVQAIKSLGKRVGVALNPATPIEVLTPMIDEIDLICLMSVNPGFGGQKFIEATIDKTAKTSALVGNRPIEIEIDGGVGSQNAGELAKNGATVLVAGSAVFGSNDPTAYQANIKAIRCQTT